MQEQKTFMETLQLTGSQVLEQLQKLLHEGNVRRITIRQGEHVIAVFPLTVGVVGAVFAPIVAAIGAIVALAADCTIEIERTEPVTPNAEESVSPVPYETEAAG